MFKASDCGRPQKRVFALVAGGPYDAPHPYCPPVPPAILSRRQPLKDVLLDLELHPNRMFITAAGELCR
jgi:hypothetical protein